MQRYAIFFIIVNALHVSGGFSVHHQELKNCTHSIWYVPGLLACPETSVTAAQYPRGPETASKGKEKSNYSVKYSNKMQMLYSIKLACCYR